MTHDTSHSDTSREHLQQLREQINNIVFIDPFADADNTIDAIMQAITATIEAEVAVAKTGWIMELPDLPYFQIVCTGKPNEYWKSHIYDTKNLPLLKLQAAQQQPSPSNQETEG